MSSKVNGKPPVGMGSVGEKNKKWQLELLMERLRSKSSNKSFPELAKSVRMALLEKRYALDAVEKSNLQKCLDSMQHCIKVTTRQGLVERLESLTRQLGLKFVEDSAGLFISSDMFYLEIVLDASGAVQDVKVHHECKIEQQSCSELVNCLVNGDFADFTTQLEGLASIYQLNAEPKIKSKAFVALQALETDLYNLYKMQKQYKDPAVMVLQSPVGVVQKRRGGHSMKLTYFVSPYELLDLETKSLTPLTVDYIHGRNVGTSVTVNLEASAANKLQIQSIFSVGQDGESIYAPLGIHNSTMLPASFVLTLNRKMPVTVGLVEQITQATEVAFGGDQATGEPLLSLIAKQSNDGELTGCSKGMFVALPDQNHCYFLTETDPLQGLVITSVPFTEPNHVPEILKLLRQQTLFNTLISSCIRSSSRHGVDSTTVFEVSALSVQHITVSLEHPYDETMATVEFDLGDVIAVQCKIFSPSRSYDTLSTKLSRIAQKCLSIPVTMRSLLKVWEEENAQQSQQALEMGNFNLSISPEDPGGQNGSVPTDFTQEVTTPTDTNPSTSTGRSIFSESDVATVVAEVEEAVGDEELPEDCASGDFADGDLDVFDADVAAEALAEVSGFQVVTAADASGKSTKKRRVEEDFWKSPKSNLPEEMNESGSNSDSNSLGADLADGGVTTASSWQQQQSDLEVTSFNISPSQQDLDGNSEGDLMEMDLMGGDGEKRAKKRSREDSNEKDLMPPFVSITPITTAPPVTTTFSSVLAGIGLDRRPGIEIIPLGATQNLSSSITITAINPSSTTAGVSPKEKKSSSSKSGRRSSTDERKGEKKKRRKRDESPMGPPDALNKPVSVSIKGSDGAPLSPSGLMRKFSSSSPKQSSPGHQQQSPKHSGLHSPKHGSGGGGSGKPSMSALKSATSSPSSKSGDKKSSSGGSSTGSSSREGSREKGEKKSSSSRSDSPKMKASSVKLKQIDLSSAFQLSSVDLQDTNKSSPPSQSKNRKGCLSAVIDKLKLAQNQTDEPKSGNGKEKSPPKSDGVSPPSSSYMVKPSLDGMKITINKTRNKESSPKTSDSGSKLNFGSSSGGGSGSNSPKTHTGLKPGVNSGPASKKSQQNSSTAKSSSGSEGNRPFQKSNSSGNLMTSSSSKSNTAGTFGKTSSGGDLTKVTSVNHGQSAEKSQRPEKSKPRNTFESVLMQANREADAVKKLGFGGSSMEGFMKALDKKFQIPKLSARSASTDEVKKESRPVSSSSAPTTPIPLMMASPTGSNSGSGSLPPTSGGVTKMLSEYLTKDLSTKYSGSGGASSSPKYGGVFTSEISLGKSLSQDSLLFSSSGLNREAGAARSNPSTPTSLVTSPFPSPVAISRSSADSPSMQRTLESDSSKSSVITKESTNSPLATMRPPSAPPTPLQTSSGDSGALDFSTRAAVQPAKSSPTVSGFPPSPSVSLHIVKSPVASPLVIPSPHSGSPCITDDELMDEALVGISGK
ncbi:Mediator of RNA polymerase II transcription subunit 1 [Sergentomyia squamirostris]